VQNTQKDSLDRQRADCAYVFYLFVMKSYKSTQKNTKKNKKKQMNKELDYDTHNDSIIRSMSAAPKIESSA